MAFEIKQTLRLSQQLVMTPQLQQAIKLLQLNRLELADVVNQELMENPMLEEVAETLDNPEGLSAQESKELQDAGEGQNPESLIQETPADQLVDKKKEEFDWESYIDDVNNSQFNAPSSKIAPDDLPSFENILTKSTSLEEHLLWQLKMSNLTEVEEKLGEFIIGNLDEDGYLQASLEDLANEVSIDIEDAGEILKMIQHFDPIGVASRTLQECLLVQARFMKPRNEMVEAIIQNHLPDLEKRNLTNICKALQTDQDKVLECTKIIREFEPKPGQLFVSTDNTQYITPDIYIIKSVNGEYVISLNEDGLPKLRVSNYYKSVLSGVQKSAANPQAAKEGAVTKEYIQDKLRAAVWLIRSIHNRQKTIYKVTESIVKHQHDFFEKGVGYLKPMILKDVANDISMHESTVSRVTTNKFVHTPVGIFELKYFFNSGISSADGGGDVASEAVKEKIKSMVSKEDPKKPLSDQRIVELLHDENIDIARRTVAKYRDMLGILSSSKRKKVF